MKKMSHLSILMLAALALAGCADLGRGPDLPTGAQQACLRSVSAETSTGEVTLLQTTVTGSGTEVIVGVGAQQARWQCIAYRDGSTSRPMSLTDEGAL